MEQLASITEIANRHEFMMLNSYQREQCRMVLFWISITKHYLGSKFLKSGLSCDLGNNVTELQM